MRRPFAQLNVGTSSEDWSKAQSLGVTVAKSKVEISAGALATTFNAFSGEASDATTATVTFNANNVIAETFKVNDVTYQSLAMNYLLVPGVQAPDGLGEHVEPAEGESVAKTTVDQINVTFYKADDDEIYTLSVPNAPIQRNYRTNIIGNLLSGDTDVFDVVVVPGFDGDNNYSELELVMANGGEITLNEDITVSSSLVVTAGKEVIINLNGKTITNKVENTNTDVIIVEEGAKLTINGTEGGVSAVTGNNGYAIISEGTLIINGGTYRSGLDAGNDGNCTIYARGNGKVYIYGGDFSTPEDDNTTYGINKQGNAVETTEIKIYGGTFKNFNPANNPADGANTNYVAEGYSSVKVSTDDEEAEIYQVVKGTGVTTNDDLNTALTADEKDIYVTLASNVTYDVAAWQNNAMGGSSTETITIDGQGLYTVIFNQTNSDWNNITTNNGAKLILKNMDITNSGHNGGPWNRHDLNFACEVEMENVSSDKALALKAGATLKNVTIDDANTSDTYAIWIQPNGQTVTIDNCTIDMIDCTDGRGIKIDDQYVTPAKVTLNVSNTTFKTDKKAAIIVKSAAGADITLSNIDITGVDADKVNAVWVDEEAPATYDLVTVTGGTKILEGDLKATDNVYYISTAAQMKAFAALVNAGNGLSGKTVKLVEDIDLNNEEWTPVGQTGTSYGATAYFQGTFDGQNHTIKNLNISQTNSGDNYAAGLFGFLDCGQTGSIKNIKVDGVSVTGHHWTGVIAGYVSGTVENCHVTNATVVCTHANNDACGDKAGVIAGYINGDQGTIKNCTASNSTVKASRDAGQIVGAAKETQVSGCTATNVSVSKVNDECTDDGAGKNITNEVIGRKL